MTWTDEAAASFASNRTRLNECDAGHARHERITVKVNLEGPCLSVPDYPATPDHLTTSFMLNVYDWNQYSGTPVYCSGNDSVSESVATQGVWEGFETLLAQAILDEGDRSHLVIDLGAQVGWYTMIAASAGYRVLAVDGDAENLDLLTDSLAINGFNGVTTALGWIGPESPVLTPGDPVRLLKADIEGAEDQALRMCVPLFEGGLIEYAFLEVSPEFSDHYPATLQQVMDYGYKGYFIPDKGTSVQAFSNDPLGYTLDPVSQITRQDVAYLKRQRNAVFVRTA